MNSKKVKLGIIFFVILIGVIITQVYFSGKGKVDDSIIIDEDPQNLVLTLDDIGEEWTEGRSWPEGKNGYFVEFLSKESSPVSQNAYKILITSWRFVDSNDAKKCSDDYIKNINIPPMLFKIGDESYFSDEAGLDILVFRENNVVIEITFLDTTTHLTGIGPKHFAKRMEQKILNASMSNS